MTHLKEPFNVFTNCFLRVYCTYRRKDKAALLLAPQVCKRAEVFSESLQGILFPNFFPILASVKNYLHFQAF